MLNLQIPFGSRSVTLPIPAHSELAVVERPTSDSPDASAALFTDARTAFEEHDRPQTKTALILSDASRHEPRGLLYAAVRQALPSVPDSHITLCIANGTHTPGDPALLGLPPEALRAHPVYNHDGTLEPALTVLGTTARGTPIHVARVAVEADLVVATGRIRPHYFAGYGAGAKAIFPGLGATPAIRQNHLLKSEASSRLGVVDGNACRDDLEEAASRVGGARVLVNVVCEEDRIVHTVAGDLRLAFRRGVEVARTLHEVPIPFGGRRADLVIASDLPPVTSTLYQACKLIPPAGQLLAPGGTLLLVAPCEQGTGPLEVVMRGIWELGVRRYLPASPDVWLHSTLPPIVASATFARPASAVDEAITTALARVTGRPPRIAILPRATDLVPVPRETGPS
jgi:nickel-dependent lactate racemase